MYYILKLATTKQHNALASLLEIHLREQLHSYTGNAAGKALLYKPHH
jgi:hypothetical protein